MEAPRISAVEAVRTLRTDPRARLVCAYPEDEKCRKVHVPGAISWSDFQASASAGELGHDATLLFYCA